MSTPMTWGTPQPERADAARNRQVLLATARELLAEAGPECLTMDLLAERSGLGKGTVFRRFGSRAGIFQALLDDSERDLQQRVLSGPPPLGPGAPAVDRIIAYGTARVRFLAEHHEVARGTLDGRGGSGGRSGGGRGGEGRSGERRRPLTEIHLRVLLREVDLPGADVDVLAGQLSYALDGPLLFQLFAGPELEGPTPTARFEEGWRDLVERVCGVPGA
ncbi:TetR/AcrR family transcriptional regulator [Promicromonospora sukumoe]|uniref:Polyketide synthase 12 n=1 Tax=Promicromonospora sukumoe TaxID=88382 RepID=A0A7W3PDG9_9MICO|nr:TetR/AcrR family transcriptional regulator [Promicromonospora sukumoe]MBA8807509.1 polyketide synthase 12 [Promicromonospora sukumoe]